MTEARLLEAIETEARKYFEDASGCHDWGHVARVRALARHIGETEEADLFVLEAAALLHDIAKNDEMRAKGGFCHAEEGAKRARPILARIGVDAEISERILHCVGTHRKRKGMEPESPEAKILFDADKLDSLGAVGIGRAFLFAGASGAVLYSGSESEHAQDPGRHEYTENDTALLEYEAHLRGLADRMLTETGRGMAEERIAFMEEFFHRFRGEADGNELSYS